MLNEAIDASHGTATLTRGFTTIGRGFAILGRGFATVAKGSAVVATGSASLGKRLPSRLAERVPMMRMLDVLYRVAPWVGKALCHSWYRHMTKLDPDATMTFMNYGFAEADEAVPELRLEEPDQTNRYCIQLYHHLAGAVDLNGQDVLEVGCGRGGGASYIARYLRPRAMVGMDLAANAIEFCQRHYAVSGLSFIQGDAERLPLSDGSFDAVVNIESSHCYPSMPQFLSEVRRVLRPGGHFLFADRRERDAMDRLQTQLAESGLELVRQNHITPNIVHALELDNKRKLDLIHKRVPLLLRKPFKQFAATRGTSMYEAFRKEHWVYSSFVLRKPT